MRKSHDPHFHELAKYYDAINDWKNYGREVRHLERLVRSTGLRGNASWLDVACGTGRHLEFLKKRHPVMGVDASKEMLDFARRRLPGVRLVRADMRTFHLDRTFDVVSCLFSAIGHLRTKEDVRTTFANFARHLNPGGVAIVEPWILPSAFRAGSIHFRSHISPDLTVVRLAFSSRRGNRSRIHYHFLIGKPNHDVQYIEYESDGLLLSRHELVEAMRSAGLRTRYLNQGLEGRGLLVGVKGSAR
jgi:ubiquinone/menaquinone biosynthesis C-methylase UbiE